MQSVDEGQSKLSVVSDLSQIASRHTTECGCQVIDAELKQLDSDYNDLKLLAEVAREKVERKLQDWVDLWKKAEGLSTWIQDTELKLASDSEYGTDVAEKTLLLERIKVL